MTLEELKQKEILFDSHAHMGFDGYTKGVREISDDAQFHGVLEIFDIAVDLQSSKDNLKRSKNFNNLKPLVGIDPEVLIPGSEMYLNIKNVDEWLEEEILNLENLIIENRESIVGIGETGIDLHHLRVAKKTAAEIQGSMKIQEKLFRKQIELAEKYNLFLSIHSRGAEKECLEILKEYKAHGIFHSFTGSLEVAEEILKTGNGLGVNGIITFKNAEGLRHIYKNIIGEVSEEDFTPSFFYKKGIFFETDAPFLAPEGKRGEINESANIKFIYEEFCRIFSEDFKKKRKWLFLTEESRAILIKKYPGIYDFKKADHITLESPMLNNVNLKKKVKFKVTGYSRNDSIEAVSVELPKDLFCQNKIPHITISYKEDTDPRDANTLLGNGIEVTEDLELEGIVDIQS